MHLQSPVTKKKRGRRHSSFKFALLITPFVPPSYLSIDVPLSNKCIRLLIIHCASVIFLRKKTALALLKSWLWSSTGPDELLLLPSLEERPNAREVHVPQILRDALESSISGWMRYQTRAHRGNSGTVVRRRAEGFRNGSHEDTAAGIIPFLFFLNIIWCIVVFVCCSVDLTHISTRRPCFLPCPAFILFLTVSWPTFQA